MKSTRSFTLMVAALAIFTLSSPVSTAAGIELAQGQTCYVPAYSHIYGGNHEQPILLAVTLSIRNTDAKNPIEITSVEYYGTEGKLLRQYLKRAITLKPFGATRFVLPQKDKTGGSGANFVVSWAAAKAVNPPIIETVMIGVEGQQGISFTSRAQAIATDN